MNPISEYFFRLISWWLVNWEELLFSVTIIILIIVFKPRGNKMINVFTNGIFDIIHPGHVHLLKHARQLGDTLTVGLNSDVSTKSIKGPNRPINNESDRFKVLKSIFYVDSVLIFDEPTPIELIKRVKPDILVKGGDYDVKNIVGKEFVESYGGKVVTIPFIYGFSTTNIISKILIAYKDYTTIKGGVL